MRVGFSMFTQFGMESVRWVARSLYEALSAGHEVVLTPADAPYRSEEARARMAEDFVRSCDVIVGVLNPGLASVRRRIGSDVPYAALMLGLFPSGAWPFRGEGGGLTTGDVLLVNSTADQELAHLFLRRPNARIIPFPYDGDRFHPLDAAEREAARARLGFGPDDRVMVYSGRITAEKNVHTVLRLFGTVLEQVPDARLVVAGAPERNDFPHFGVTTPRYARTFQQLVQRLGLPRERVHLVGNAPGPMLRDLYAVADVKVNLTLHHDENFGLAQVEAMACGTPVVGTAWGGLRDTIVDGVSGWRVSTVATPSGVMVSWWEAVNRIVELMRGGEARERLRESCIRHAEENYSEAAFRARLDEVLEEAVERRGEPAEPLRPTEFAQEFWSVCAPQADPRPPFRRGPRSFELYTRIFDTFSAAMPSSVAPEEPLEPAQVLSLSTPIAEDGEGGYRLDHGIYPFPVEVPDEHGDAFRALLHAFRDQPATTVERLLDTRAASVPGAAEALRWMLAQGLVLRTRPVDGWADPGAVDRRMSQVLFTVQPAITSEADLLLS